MVYKATWERFEYLNENKTKSFENLCRLLFKRTFFDKKTIFQSIPNTPGIEVLPIYCNELNKRINEVELYTLHLQ